MAAEGAAKPAEDVAKKSIVTASARSVARKCFTPSTTWGRSSCAGAPKLRVSVVPAKGGAAPLNASASGPLEFAIAPGQTIMLKVRVERNGFKGGVSLGNEGSGRNLPFGVIVDNLGLNGLLILENQDEREFFITADANTREQTRHFHLTTAAGGGQSSRPVILHVRRPQIQAARVQVTH